MTAIIPAKFEALVWLKEKRPELVDRLVVRNVTSLDELSATLSMSVTPEMLNSRPFRKQYSITMASSIRDKDGGIVYEDDIVAYGSRYNESNYHRVRYGFFDDESEPLFSLHRAGESIIWREKSAANSTRIASRYDNPDAYSHLFFTHSGQ